VTDLGSFATFVGPFLPELLLLAGALIVFLLDALGIRRVEISGGIATVVTALGILLVLADLGASPFAGLSLLSSGQIDPVVSPASAPLYSFTSLGLVFQLFFLLSAFLVSLGSLSRPSRERGSSVFFGLLLIATLGMMLVGIAADLIFLILAIEVVSIATYLLVAYTRHDTRSVEAAMKFYIIGALSTVLSLFGAALLFGAFGTTNLYAIEGSVVGAPTLVLLGYGLLVAGLAFKVTLVPFHAWAVDVYDGAPHDVSAFLAGGTKKIGLFAFFLVFIGPLLLARWGASFNPLGGPGVSIAPILQILLAVLAVVTMTIGNLLALQQKEIKRMLAYSSISQAGYMLIGITVATAPSIAGATLQIFAHVILTTGAFLVVATVAGLGVGVLIDDWKGVGLRRPYLGVAFSLMLLGLAGIPLTVGFVSKFVLFSSAIQAQGYFVWLAIAGVLNSAASVFYYARVIKVMFLDSPDASAPTGRVEQPELAFQGMGYGRAAAIGLVAVLVVFFGIDPQPILGIIQTAAQHFVLVGP
jgi:proton-translocating NADH-quinone oxidoreductase chain N